MVIFHSYVKLPEGNILDLLLWIILSFWAPLYPWRIHGAGIYANMGYIDGKCYHIYHTWILLDSELLQFI